MGFGITEQGFLIKRLTDIEEEVDLALRQSLGQNINLLPTELLGQMKGVFVEREALIWELAQDVYNSQYPDTASGVSLDNVVAITGIKRLQATKSNGEGVARGTEGVLIGAGKAVSVDGDSEARFLTTLDAIIGPGTDEVQLVQFSSVPDAGNWTLRFDGEETTTLFFNSLAIDVENALNNLVAIGGGASVAGDFTTGFIITFDGAPVNQQPLQLVQLGTSTLETLIILTALDFSRTTAGLLPNVTVPVEAETAGDVRALSGTLTVIEDTVIGWDSFTNVEDIDNGKEIESDPDLKLRRGQTLATSGAGTIEALRSSMLNIDAVTAARVFENDTMVTDAFGRPAKSFEAVVQNGDEQEIADELWIKKPAGIEPHGDIIKTVVDSDGFDQTIKFSRPTEIEIFIDLNLVTSPEFPVDGELAVKQAIVDYGTTNFSIGDDVISKELYCAIFAIAGVLDADIFIGLALSPTTDANVIIQDDEISDFDTGRITIL